MADLKVTEIQEIIDDIVAFFKSFIEQLQEFIAGFSKTYGFEQE